MSKESQLVYIAKENISTMTVNGSVYSEKHPKSINLRRIARKYKYSSKMPGILYIESKKGSEEPTKRYYGGLPTKKQVRKEMQKNPKITKDEIIEMMPTSCFKNTIGFIINLKYESYNPREYFNQTGKILEEHIVHVKLSTNGNILLTGCRSQKDIDKSLVIIKELFESEPYCNCVQKEKYPLNVHINRIVMINITLQIKHKNREFLNTHKLRHIIAALEEQDPLSFFKTRIGEKQTASLHIDCDFIPKEKEKCFDITNPDTVQDLKSESSGEGKDPIAKSATLKIDKNGMIIITGRLSSLENVITVKNELLSLFRKYSDKLFINPDV